MPCCYKVRKLTSTSREEKVLNQAVGRGSMHLALQDHPERTTVLCVSPHSSCEESPGRTGSLCSLCVGELWSMYMFNNNVPSYNVTSYKT